MELSAKAMRVLILGGTTEANVLAAHLAGDARLEPILSLAGRTQSPRLPDIQHRIGGFGGVPGLIGYLRAKEIGALIDATHPFAEQISAHAIAAAHMTQVPLAAFTRPAWTKQAADRWREVPDAKCAALNIGATPRRVFLAIGRLQLAAFEAAPHHSYLIRSVEPPEPRPALPHHRLIIARGPFALEDEIALLRREDIDVLVTKNSGGDATRAKIDAARELKLEVLMINRPRSAGVVTYESIDDVLKFIGAQLHRAPP
jgi:precorrin-6A/cobalt-precorrin-6A reductase